jgi:hypothetical protein
MRLRVDERSGIDLLQDSHVQTWAPFQRRPQAARLGQVQVSDRHNGGGNIKPFGVIMGGGGRQAHCPDFHQRIS